VLVIIRCGTSTHNASALLAVTTIVILASGENPSDKKRCLTPIAGWHSWRFCYWHFFDNFTETLTVCCQASFLCLSSPLPLTRDRGGIWMNCLFLLYKYIYSVGLDT
jgi:hypothetical protein